MARNTTIHKLNFQLMVDSSKFEKGMIASKKELAFAKREMKAMQTPAEKMEVRLKKLGDLAKKDAKFQGLYNEALRRSRTQMDKTAASAGRMNKVFGKLGKMKGAALGAIAGVALGARAIGRTVSRSIDRMDKLAKAADKLGTSTEFISRLQFVAGQTSGLESGAVQKALEKMTIQLADAAKGTGEAKDVLRDLGLEAKELVKLGPEKAFERISRSMDGITNATERAGIATKLFGLRQMGIHTTMALSEDAMARMNDESDRLGKTITSFDASKMAMVKDSMGEMSAAMESFSTQFTLTLGPSIIAVLDKITLVMESLPGGSDGTAPELKGGDDISFGNYWGAAVETAMNSLNPNHVSAEGLRNLDWFAPKEYFKNLDKAEKAQRQTLMDRKDASGFRNADLSASSNMDRLLPKNREAVSKMNVAGNVESFDKAAGSVFDFMGDIVGKKKKTAGLFGTGKVTQQGQTGLISQGINNLLGGGAGLAGRARGLLGGIPGTSAAPMTAQQITKTSSGPMASIGAGSSEAFRFLNKQTSSKATTIDLEKKRTKSAETTVTLLEQMKDLMAHGKESEFANLEGADTSGG